MISTKFYGSKLNTVLLLVLIILMVVAIKIMLRNEQAYFPKFKQNAGVVDTKMPVMQDNGDLLGNKEDLISFSISPQTKVQGILSYRGIIQGGYFFEGNILINILDSNKNLLKKSNAMATTDWMTIEPVEFEGNIDFAGLPSGPAYFEIHNDNASGLPENDKSVLIPIVIE